MLPWLLAAAFGALYGVAELLQRYQDAPLQALRTRWGLTYIATNGSASLAAVALIREFHVDLGMSEDSSRDLVQVLVAGFAAMAVLRSSVFTARFDGKDVAIGPATILKSVLDTCDRGVDRIRAQARAADISGAMQGVSLHQALFELPELAFKLLRHIDDDEQARIGRSALKTAKSDLPERTKIHVLGLALMDLIGKEALLATVALMHDPDRRVDRP